MVSTQEKSKRILNVVDSLPVKTRNFLLNAALKEGLYTGLPPKSPEYEQDSASTRSIFSSLRASTRPLEDQISFATELKKSFGVRAGIIQEIGLGCEKMDEAWGIFRLVALPVAKSMARLRQQVSEAIAGGHFSHSDAQIMLLDLFHHQSLDSHFLNIEEVRALPSQLKKMLDSESTSPALRAALIESINEAGCRSCKRILGLPITDRDIYPRSM